MAVGARMILDLIGRPDAPIDTAALSDEVARRLRREIFSGTWDGGQPLKQLEIAERFGVSAVPVREAFQRLAAEGLVVPQRNRGVAVAHLTKADFVDISELRILLEPQALRRSAPNLTRADLDEAAAILDAAEESRDVIERSERHWAFHRRLYARAERPRLLATIDTLYLQINRYLLKAWTEAGLSADWNQSHEAIVECLRRGEIEAAAEMVRVQAIHATERVLEFLASSNARPIDGGAR
jgi:DNA-binding GntR family transcriptional regulator